MGSGVTVWWTTPGQVESMTSMSTIDPEMSLFLKFFRARKSLKNRQANKQTDTDQPKQGLSSLCSRLLGFRTNEQSLAHSVTLPGSPPPTSGALFNFFELTRCYFFKFFEPCFESSQSTV